MNFCDRPIIITDLETTGISPTRHEIIEFGAVKVDHQLNELGRFMTRVRPEHIETAEPEALEINGYDPAFWKWAPNLQAALVAYAEFSKNGILCAWNITFEYTFLQEAFRRLTIGNAMDYHRIDIPSIAWTLMSPFEKFNMDAVAQRFGMSPEPHPHRAITGAEYELKILRQLRGTK